MLRLKKNEAREAERILVEKLRQEIETAATKDTCRHPIDRTNIEHVENKDCGVCKRKCQKLA